MNLVGTPPFPTIHTRRAAAALEVPGGIGSYYFGEREPPDGLRRVVLYMVEPEKKDEAIPALIAISPKYQLGLPKDPARFDVLKGAYDFAQLYACHQVVLGAMLNSDLFRSLGIDAFTNRVRLGIGDLTEEPSIRARLTRLGVPPDMLVVEEQGFPDQNIPSQRNSPLAP